MSSSVLQVYVYGAGKVGTTLGRAWRQAGLKVTVRRSRRGLPRRPILADVVVLAVRDGDIAAAAADLAAAGLLGAGPRRQVVVHCAGSVGPDALAAVRSPRVAVGQMHPLHSFAAPGRSTGLAGSLLLLRGDPRAVAAAAKLGRVLGMRPRAVPELDLALYHAAAALVANGAATLAAEGARLLVEAGMAPELAPGALGPLLRSVADNVEALGVPDALTGPVRRGDHRAVAAHLAALTSRAPASAALYTALARAQLDMAAGLGDASGPSLRAVERVLRRLKPLKKKDK